MSAFLAGSDRERRVDAKHSSCVPFAFVLAVAAVNAPATPIACQHCSAVGCSLAVLLVFRDICVLKDSPKKCAFINGGCYFATVASMFWFCEQNRVAEITRSRVRVGCKG